MARAKAKTGIEGRMIVTGVRHVGVESIEQAALRPGAGIRW
jgi:adenosine deaminase